MYKFAVIAPKNTWEKDKIEFIMKILKGCLSTIIVFILLFTIGYFFYKNSVISNLESSRNKINSNWKSYIENINLRNRKLIQENPKNDSILSYLKCSEKIQSDKFSREFEFIEYKINCYLMSENIENSFAENLNANIDIYNQSVREYNTYRVTFPNSLIARKTKYPKYFDYFDMIKYGIENRNPKVKRAKIDYWIINGGEYPK